MHDKQILGKVGGTGRKLLQFKGAHAIEVTEYDNDEWTRAVINTRQVQNDAEHAAKYLRTT